MRSPALDMSSRFRPAVRLTSRVEFRAVQQRGRRVAARYVTLLGRPNDRGCDRLGIIASREVGGAVVRNRAKRRLREMFRHAGAGPGDSIGPAAVRRRGDRAARAGRRAVRRGRAPIFRRALRKLRGDEVT